MYFTGSPIHHHHHSPSSCNEAITSSNISLSHHLQRLHLQQQQQTTPPQNQSPTVSAESSVLYQQFLQQGCASPLSTSSPRNSPTSEVTVGSTSVTSITQGLSGLSTNTGSITQGTPSSNNNGSLSGGVLSLASAPVTAMPLDIRVQSAGSSSPHHVVHLHHRSPVTTPVQHSPSNSPLLGMIQEENNSVFHLNHIEPDEGLFHGESMKSRMRLGNITVDRRQFVNVPRQAQLCSPHYPQISVTDEMGGEVTLVACSSSSSSNSSSDLAHTDGNDIRGMDEMIVESAVPSDMDCVTSSVISDHSFTQPVISAPFGTCLYSSETDSTSKSESSHFPPSTNRVPSHFDISPPNTILPSFLISGPCDFSRPSIVRGIGKQQHVNKEEEEQLQHAINSETKDSFDHLDSMRHQNSSQVNLIGSADSRTSPEGRRDAYAQHKNVALRYTFPPAYFFTGHTHNVDHYFSEDSSSNDTETFQQFHQNHRNESSVVYENGKNILFKDVSVSSDNAVSLTGSVLASDLLQKTSSGSFKLTLSDVCSQLNASDILGRIKRLIDARAPPKCFAFSHSEIGDSGRSKEGALALEYPGGVQIELRVCEDTGCELKGLKMRRISGDHFQYNQLCQELISCMTV